MPIVSPRRVAIVDNYFTLHFCFVETDKKRKNAIFGMITLRLEKLRPRAKRFARNSSLCAFVGFCMKVRWGLLATKVTCSLNCRLHSNLRPS